MLNLTLSFINFSLLLSEENASDLDSEPGTYQNFRLDEVMDYLLTKNYSSTLIHGFSQLTSKLCCFKAKRFIGLEQHELVSSSVCPFSRYISSFSQ